MSEAPLTPGGQPPKVGRPARPWMRRLRRFGGVLMLGGVGVLGLALIGTGCGYLWLRTGAGQRFLTASAERGVQSLLSEGTVELGALHTDLFTGLWVQDLVLKDGAGRVVIGVPSAELHLDPWALLKMRAKVTSLQMDGAWVDLQPGADGQLDVLRMFGVDPNAPASTEPWAGLPVQLWAPDVRLTDLSVALGPPASRWVSFSGLDVQGALLGEGSTFSAPMLDASGELVAPGAVPVRLVGSLGYEVNSGAVRLPLALLALQETRLALHGEVLGPEFGLVGRAAPLDLLELDGLIGGVGLAGAVQGPLSVVGPWDDVKLVAQLDGVGTARGGLDADLNLNLLADNPTWVGTVTARKLHVLDVAPVAGTELVLDGLLTVDGAGLNPLDGATATLSFKGEKQEIVGFPVEAVRLEAGLAGGVLTLKSGSTLDGFVGRLLPEGTIDLARGPMDMIVNGSLDDKWLATLGAPKELSLRGSFSALIKGNFKESNRIDAEGQYQLNDVRWASLGRVDGVNGRFDATVIGADVGVDFSALVDGIDGPQVHVAQATADALHLEVSPAGAVTLSGDVTLSTIVGGAAEGYAGARVSEAVAAVGFAMAEDGVISADVEASLGSFDLATFPGTGGIVVASMNGDKVELQAQLMDDKRPLVGAHLFTDLGTGASRVSNFALAPTPRLSWEAPSDWEFTLTEAGVRDARLALNGDLGTMRVDGTLGMTGPLDGSVTLDGLELDVLAELFPDWFSGLAGRADLVLVAAGDAANPDLMADVNVTGLWVEDQVRWLDIKGTVEASDGQVKPDLTFSVAGEALADVVGAIPASLDLSAVALLPAEDVSLEVSLRPGSFARLERVRPGGLALPEGELSLSLTAKGPLRDPDFRLAGITELAVPGWAERGRVELEVVREGEQLDGFASVREGFVQRGTLGGGGITRVGEVFAWLLDGGPEPDMSDPTLIVDAMVVSAVLLGVPVQSLLDAAGSDLPLGGELVGGISAFGSPWAPELEAGVHWLDGSIGKLPVEGAYLAVEQQEGALGLTLDVQFSEGGLNISGPVPVSLDMRKEQSSWFSGPLDLTVSGDGVPLAALDGLGLGVSGGAGIFSMSGNVGGTASDPNPELEAHIVDGAMALSTVGLRLEDTQLDVEMSGHKIKLTRFDARTSPIRASMSGLSGDDKKSRVKATGTALLNGEEPARFQGRVTFEQAWVAALTDALARVDGALTVGGEWPALEVRGDVKLFQGRYIADANTFASASPVLVDPVITVRRALSAEPTASAPLPPPFYADFDVRVDLDLARNLDVQVTMPFLDDLGSLGAAVTQADVDARIGGEVQLTMQQAEVAMIGELDVVDGRVSVLRAKFEQLKGSLAFSGNEITNPNLDLDAKAIVGGASIDLKVRGTPEKPDLDFSSDTYTDQTQILSILLTGTAPDDLSTNQGRATAEALTSLLLSSALSGSNLGNVSIDPSGSVAVGFPVNQRVYATTKYNGRATPQQNRFSAQLEVSFGPQILWVLGSGEVYQWTEIAWEKRF